MSKQRIVVAGAGYAGVLTAKKIAKQVKKKKLGDQVEITIIDRNPFHTMLTELHEVAAWRVEEDSIKISLQRVFAGRDVSVALGTIQTIDYQDKKVVCENQVYPYDYLVLASGSQPIFFGVEGAKENAFTLWSYEDAVLLREHFMQMFRKAAVETDLDKKKELLTFVVTGCGFTGVEMAGELAEMVPFMCQRFEIDPALVTIVNMDMLDRVCTILPEKLSTKIVRRLEKMHVQVLLGASTTHIEKGSLTYTKDGKSHQINSQTVIWTAGVESSDLAKEASQQLGAAPRGRIQTDHYLRAQDNPQVYVGGDNIYYIPEGESNAVPQMVENCEASAETIAHNILVDVTGQGEREKYQPKFHGSMVCVGGRYGVAHVGLPGKFFGLPSFLAMFSKHFINIIYFIQVLGWNKVFSYIRHEFFTIRDCRSFVGGHFSNRSPSFFLVPLRVFLGLIWLYEGIVKVGEGWFKQPMLTAFFQGANNFYLNIMNGGAVDATSAASAGEEAVSLGELIFRLDLFNQFRFILVKSGEYAFRIQVGFVDWIINTLVLPSDTVQMIFQIVIVSAEILIGLALIGGLFTTPAAGASLMLQAMFLTSTGLYMSTWWMLFAGIAMLFGAGRVLSLDYYAMPWLKKKWQHVPFARKWYLYHD